MISVGYKERCLFYRCINRYIVYNLCYRKMFDPVILIVVDIVSKILFNNLVESFYLFIGLKMKDYRKFVVHFKFYYKCCEEL